MRFKFLISSECTSMDLLSITVVDFKKVTN